MGLSVGSGLGEERTEGPRGTPRRGVTGTPGRGLEAVTRGSGAAPSESRRLWEPRPLIYYFIPTLRRLGPRLKPATRVRALDPEWPLWPFRACGRSVHPAAPAGPRRLQAPWPRPSALQLVPVAVVLGSRTSPASNDSGGRSSRETGEGTKEPPAASPPSPLLLQTAAPSADGAASCAQRMHLPGPGAPWVARRGLGPGPAKCRFPRGWSERR